MVRLDGIGLHSGARVTAELRPATRTVFVRDGTRIPATLPHVVDSRLATTLGAGGVRIAMVEHLCAALYATGVSAEVVVDGPELPVLDGSALPWLEVLDHAGAVGDAPAPVRVTETIEVHDGAGWARLEPADTLELDLTVDFDHPLIGTQRYRGVVADDFRGGIAPGRTFGFFRDGEALRAAGLARGASLDNTVVYAEDRVMNPGGLRAPDEAVRHKALDAVGDLSLLGAPLHGRLVGYRAGHALHHAVVRRLLDATKG